MYVYELFLNKKDISFFNLLSVFPFIHFSTNFFFFVVGWKEFALALSTLDPWDCRVRFKWIDKYIYTNIDIWNK